MARRRASPCVAVFSARFSWRCLRCLSLVARRAIINNPGRALRLTIQGKKGVRSLAYSKDGKRLARGEGNHVVVCCAESGLEQCQLRGEKPIQCLAFSRNGRILAAGDGWVPGGKDYSIRFYDAESGTQIGCPLTGHDRYFF